MAINVGIWIGTKEERKIEELEDKVDKLKLEIHRKDESIKNILESIKTIELMYDSGNKDAQREIHILVRQLNEFVEYAIFKNALHNAYDRFVNVTDPSIGLKALKRIVNKISDESSQ
jgi:hypothetical protein